VEHGERVEVIFDRDATELRDFQLFLVDPSHGYAPVRTLVSGRPTPAAPCSPPGGGRGTVIERGFLLGTGYFEDLEPQLEEWLARGVITDAQYHALKDSDLPDS